MRELDLFNGFYEGKKVMVTGHTGFKGGWLSLWLNQLGARVYGISHPPFPSPNLFEVIGQGTFERDGWMDVRVLAAVYYQIEEVMPDIIFHLAGQPIVSEAFESPLSTIETNTMGTLSVLESVRRHKLKIPVVVITTDKVYDAHVQNCEETDDFSWSTPYSMSKVAAELACDAYRNSYGLNVATARAGNVIGGGDYAANRLIPDCFRAFSEGKDVDLRQPFYLRPWQHVLDCICGYLKLGENFISEAFNFGPDGPLAQVYMVALQFKERWPGRLGCSLLKRDPLCHEDRSLSLCSDKAKEKLGWAPRYDTRTAVRAAADWYIARHVEKNESMREFTINQIREFVHYDPTNRPQRPPGAVATQG